MMKKVLNLMMGVAVAVLGASVARAEAVPSVVAKIGEVRYETLSAAVHDAEPGATVQLQTDVAETVTADESAYVIVDLCGHTISNSTVAVDLTQAAGACLVLFNGTVRGALKVGSGNVGKEGNVLILGDGLTAQGRLSLRGGSMAVFATGSTGAYSGLYDVNRQEGGSLLAFPGARFAVDQTPVLGNPDDVRLKALGDGMYVAEAISEEPSAEPARVASPAHTFAAASAEEKWEPSLADWMATVTDGTMLGELCMPASHDAGMIYSRSKPGAFFVSKRAFCTQDLTVGKQLENGARYFDFRPYANPLIDVLWLKLVSILFQSYEIKARHFEWRGPGVKMGGIGDTFKNMFDEIRDFLDRHPGEIVMVNLSHWQTEGAKDGDLNKRLVMEFLKQEKYSKYFYCHQGPLVAGGLNCVTIGDVRKSGRRLIILLSDYGDAVDPANGYWGVNDFDNHFDRLNGATPTNNAFNVVGTYSDMNSAKAMEEKQLNYWKSWHENCTNKMDFAYKLAWEVTLSTRQSILTSVENIRHFAGDDGLSIEDWATRAKDLLKADLDIHVPIWGRPTMVNLDFIDSNACRAVVDINEELTLPKVTLVLSDDVNRAVQRLFDNALEKWQLLSNGVLTDLAPPSGTGTKEISLGRCKPGPVSLVFSGWFYDYTGRAFPVVRTVKLAEVVRSSPDMTVELAKSSLPTEYNNGILPDFHEWNESTGALVVRQLAVPDAQQKKIRDIADAGAFLDAGNFYFVFTNTVCRERLTVRGKGKTHLILCDGATLTAEGGITVEPAGAELNICCQGAGTGALVATGRAGDAGIGGLRGQPGGNVRIHGGVVRATGSVSEINTHGSGIGGSGAHSKGGTLTVYGGEVIAAGGEGAGYGFGNGGDPLNVSALATSDSLLVWRGGTVTLSCGDRTNSLHRVLTALGAKLSIGPNARSVCWGGATPAALLPLTTDAEIAAAKYLKIEKGAVLTLPRKVPGLTCQLVRYGHVLAGTEVGDRVFYRLNSSDHVRLDFKADEGYRLDGPCYETYQLEDGDVHLWEANFPSRAVRLCTLTLPVDTGALTYSVSPTGSVAAVTNGSCAVWTFDEGTSVSVTFAAKSGVSIDGSSELSYPDIAADQVVGLGDLPKVSCDYADESGGTASVAARVMPVTLAELADGETYFAHGETVLTNRLRVTGAVRLVLADDAVLTAKKGVEVAAGRTLDICGQQDGTGCLICQGAQECAGIGGGRGGACGTVNVFGGEIRTVGGGYAAGLGGGSGGSGGTVRISGGYVQAGGGYGGAGIGGGCAFAGDTLDGGSLTVSGGAVSAGGGYAAAGIGGGMGGHGARVEVNGGYVAATGYRSAAGIGGGSGGNGNDVVVSRGALVATAGAGAQGIGAGEGGTSSGGLEHSGMEAFAGADSRSAAYSDNADAARKQPFVALLKAVQVTLTAEAWARIASVGENVAVKLKSAGGEITLEPRSDGTYVGYAAAGFDLQLVLVPPPGYGFGSHDGTIPLTTVRESDIRVTLQGVSLPTLIKLSPVSYWEIEGETAVERTRNSYVEVSAATASLEDGQWYVVTGEVTIGRRLPVHGHAHLILCDGAVLTVNGGIEVNRQNDVSDALDIHGSINGTGRLVAIATGERTAGIGGSHEAVVVQGLSGGVVTVCRAEVVAVGGRNGGAGIGGAWGGDGGEVYVCDAVVTATGGDYQGRDGERLHGAGIGAGARDFAGEGDSGWLWMLGGETVVWSGESAETAKADVFCTMRNKYCRIEPGKAVSLPATFEAMTYEVSADGSAPLTGRTVDGRTYFVLPRDCAALTVTFAAKPGCEIWRGDSTVTLTDFSATVSEFPADRLPSAAEPVPYVVRNGATTNDLTRLDYVSVMSATTGLTNGQWGVVRGEVTLEERLHITGSATILLADDAKLIASRGVDLADGNTLTVYTQRGNGGELVATGVDGAAGVGGAPGVNGGSVVVNGGRIVAVGGLLGEGAAPGIGGGVGASGGALVTTGYPSFIAAGPDEAGADEVAGYDCRARYVSVSTERPAVIPASLTPVAWISSVTNPPENATTPFDLPVVYRHGTTSFVDEPANAAVLSLTDGKNIRVTSMTRLTSLKVYESGVLVRHYVPVCDANRPYLSGLYDLTVGGAVCGRQKFATPVLPDPLHTITPETPVGFRLAPGNVYTVLGSNHAVRIHATSATRPSALTVTDAGKTGEPAFLHVPAGESLEVFGLNARGMTGAGAGIQVEESSLVLLGRGTLRAFGGNAASGENGEKTPHGYITNYTGKAADWAYGNTGRGGHGGNGGGGAGAGIGGRGGSGGSGGRFEYIWGTGNQEINSCGKKEDWMRPAMDGVDGGAGAAGGKGGVVTRIGDIEVRADGGKKGDEGCVGEHDPCYCTLCKKTAWDTKKGLFSTEHLKNWFEVYSGGYGGGGGGGRSASGIGSGGGGGGGGGSGGGGKPGMFGEDGDFGNLGCSADEEGWSGGAGGKAGNGGKSGAEGQPTEVKEVAARDECEYEPLKRRLRICDGEKVLVEANAALGYSLPDLSDALSHINEQAPSGQAMQGAFFGAECWYGSDALPRVPSYDRIENVTLQVRWVSTSVLDHQAELPTLSNYVWDGTEKTGVVKIGAGSLFASGTLKATDVGNYSVNLKLDRNGGVNAWADGTRTDPRSFSWRITKPPLAGNVVFNGGELTRGQSLDDVRVDSAPAGSVQKIVSTRRLSPGLYLVTIRVTNPNYDGAVEVSAEFAAPETVTFRRWNGSFMETTERGDVVMVTRDMTTLDSGWFAVFNDVTLSAGLCVSGDVHLVLTDGATLTVTGGVEVVARGSLSVYGQDYGLGSLRAFGASGHDGIGTRNGDCGPVTVHGGIVMALGGENAAGIGGELTVYGGSVLARGSARSAFARTCRVDASYPAALLEGADEESLRIVTELSGSASCVNIVPGVRITVPQKMSGFESCVISNELQILPGVTTDTGDTVYTVPYCSDVCLDFRLASGFRLADDSTPICGWLCVWEDVVIGSRDYPIPSSAILPVDVPYLAWSDGVWVTNVAEGVTCLSSGVKITLGNGWYAVWGEVDVMDRIEVTGDAHLILCDGAKLMAPAGIEVNVRDALTIYGQAEGTGALEARGRYGEAGIGGGYENRSSGTVTVHGGVIMAVGGSNGAGIGGGRHYQGGTVLVYGGVVTATGGELSAGIGGSERNDGGTVTISGGRVTATGGTNGAGIGGGFNSLGGTVTISGGTVVATGKRGGEDIGGGAWGTYGDSVLTISGGSVKAKLRDGLAKNPANDRLSCVTVKCEGLDGLVNLEGLEGYGTNDIFAIDGCVYLWLPDGTHSFALSNGEKTLHYFAAVNGRNITVEPHPEIGLFVNGAEIVNGKGPGWTYDGQCLRFEAEDFYVLSGFSTNDEVRIVVEQPSVTLSLLNAVVLAKDHSALEVKSGTDVTLLMAGGTSILAATNGASAVTVEADAKLTVGLAPEADRLESALCVFNSGVEVPAVGGAGEAVVAGGTFLAWGEGQAVGLPTFNVGEDEVMKVGEDPDTARFAVTCGNASCVLVAPAVTVTVRDDIPHVSGFMVSNAVEAVAGQSVSGGTAYRVMLSDDVSVGYMLEAGFVSDAENPFTYASFEHDVTIDASMIAVGVLVAPGVPVVFNSAAEASNAVARAELTPSAEVAAVFSEDADAKSAYCAKFGIGVVPTADGKWAVEAVLLPEPWTNVVESAQMATRQIPVAEIATLGPGGVTNVTVEGCVPGFYYTIYGGSTVTNLKAFVSETSRNVICKPGKPVTFSEVVKPSATAGFFTIGVKEAPGVTPSDKISPKSEPPAAIEIHED